MKFLKFIRFPNLLIVVLTQYLIRYLVLYPVYQKQNINFYLSDNQFLYLVIATVLLTLGGYVINDIYDNEIDKINKPNKVFVGKYISTFNSWKLYFFVNIIGFGLSFWVAFEVNYLEWLFFYPLGWLALWWYSFRLKKMLLWGNVLVSGFCAWVALLIWFSEKASFQKLLSVDVSEAQQLIEILLFYSVFAFLSNLFREIAKDMEDVKGDKLYGCKTLPIVVGYKKTQQFALGIVGFLIVLLILFFKNIWNNSSLLSIIYSSLFLLLPLIYIAILLLQKSKQANYKRISILAKLLMLFGLLLLPILKF